MKTCMVVAFCLLTLLTSHLAVAGNRTVLIDEETGIVNAVAVDDQALAHTTQLLPFDAKGQIAAGDLAQQIVQLTANLTHALAQVGSDATNIVRLNVYMSAEAKPSQVQEILTRHLLNEVRPAATYVVTKLAEPGALVAADAIAVVPNRNAAQVVRTGKSQLSALHGATLVSVLPRGRVVYISGMAERTDELAAATAGTMKQLHQVLALLGLNSEHVVHVKAYMKPMSDAAIARDIIQESYPAGKSPSISFVEWLNGLPIEIEMIAYLPGDADPQGSVDLRWQPGEKRSPVYCRFAVVDSPKRIYISGLRSRRGLSADQQVRDIFSQLGTVLDDMGSDMQHLAKATYYVADDEVSKALNEIRPEFYDPERPPAASKAMISGTGDPERPITIDMIAVEK